jgi:hypothetical protein
VQYVNFIALLISLELPRRKPCDTEKTSGKKLVEHGSPPVIQPLLDFDWQRTVPRKFRPFRPIYHITMGTEPLTESPSL